MIYKKLFIVGALFISGCTTTSVGPPSTVQAAEVVAPNIVGRWKLVSINGISVNSGKVILVFEADGRYRRQVSCNQGLGTYHIADGVLSLGVVSETERGCDAYDNEALIDEAVNRGPWTATAQGNDAFLLEGRHRLHLRRYRG